MGAHATRQRYWARSMFGFSHIERASPNSGHIALANAQSRHKIHHIITQVRYSAAISCVNGNLVMCDIIEC